MRPRCPRSTSRQPPHDRDAADRGLACRHPRRMGIVVPPRSRTDCRPGGGGSRRQPRCAGSCSGIRDDARCDCRHRNDLECRCLGAGRLHGGAVRLPPGRAARRRNNPRGFGGGVSACRVQPSPATRGEGVRHSTSLTDTDAGPAVIEVLVTAERRSRQVISGIVWTVFPPGSNQAVRLEFTTPIPAMFEALSTQSVVIARSTVLTLTSSA